MPGKGTINSNDNVADIRAEKKIFFNELAQCFVLFTKQFWSSQCLKCNVLSEIEGAPAYND